MSTNSNNSSPSLEERQEFFKLCQSHDWYYEYSDDGRDYRKGRDQLDKIRSMAAKHKDYREIYTSWVKYKFSSARRGNEKSPKPIMPE